MDTTTEQRSFGVLWRWNEAERLSGLLVTDGVGRHSGGLRRGDQVFIWATRANELYLLGAISVISSGASKMKGTPMYGPFQIVPLGNIKWKIRFEGSKDRLHKRIELAMQVRARRRIQPESAKLLAEVLERNTRKIAKRASAIDKEIRYCEGQRKATNVLSPIRNRKLRADALARRGFICEVCKFDFEAVYGDFARLCVEVHHIVPIHLARQRGVKTSWKDVIVICPNCHGALHRFHQPTNLKAFMKAVKAKSGA